MRKSLNGIWKLNSLYLKEKGLLDLKCQVPGSIYHDLLNNKVIDDPFYRDNEIKMLDLMRYDYAYSRKFTIKKEELNNEINLGFLGLDTISIIYINDLEVARTYNMHRRYLFNINKYLKVGENTINVVIKSCLDFINEEKKKIKHELMNMHYAVNGYATIRKAHCMFGWDWGPQMPDGGIWRDVYLEFISKGRLDDVIVCQETSIDKSILNIKINKYLLDDNLKIKVELAIDDYSISKVLDAKESLITLEVDKPKLWYPVGYGKQNLYILTVSLLDGKNLIDQKTQRIGLRDLKIKREKDKYGESFTCVVNGVEVFIKGSDYIIEDNLLPRATIDHTRFLLTSARDCNQNTIRVWGGGLYPSDEFFNLCDELGLLVWQDLMFACGYYDMENEFFVNEIKEEIKDNISRIHNHPCIMLICGNNENETAALDWNIPSPEYTKKWYLYQYEELIPSILKEIAPDIFYWPSSPSSGGGFNKPNSDDSGDMHYWGVWHGNEPIENYRLHYPRMLSEFGMQSFPCMKTINSFTKEEDRNIYSYVMERHQKNISANQKIMNYIGSMFKYPKNLEYISYVSELIQAEAVRYCVEHLRRNNDRCKGAIYWQLNDCWPVASWSSIDYYNRYKALQYYSKRFYAPIMVSIEESNTTNYSYTITKGTQKAKIVGNNDTYDEIKGIARWELADFDGNIIKKDSKEYSIKPFSKEVLFDLDFNLDTTEQMSTVLRVFMDDGKTVHENSVSFVRDKYLNLRKPNIDVRLDKKGETHYLYLNSDTFTKYVWVDLKNQDVIFSDNFINLFKGEEKVIRFKTKKEISIKDIKIINLTDSY